MDAMKKRFRLVKLNASRLKDQMIAVTKVALDIESLSKLESLLGEFREVKKQFDEVVQEMFNQLDESESNFESTCTALMKDSASISDILSTFEGKVKSFHKKLSIDQKRESLVPQSLNASMSKSEEYGPKLERIQVPNFDGEILNFPNFRSLFENLIHSSETLSNVQKLFYLKKAMTEKAKDLLRDFNLTETAYSEAWSYLCNRFDNKRLITRALFRKLTNIEPVKGESKIQELVDQVDIVLRGLRSNGEYINETFSRFIAFFVSSKLDYITSRDWENSVTTCEAFPKFEELKKFLLIRAFSVEDNAIGKFGKLTSSPKKTSLSTTVSKAEKSSYPTYASQNQCCLVCSKSHNLSTCKEFLAMTQAQRFDIVKANKVCIKCLRSGHAVFACRARPCESCQGRHHSLLHRESSFQAATKRVEEKVESKPSPTPSSSSPIEVSSTKTTLSVSIENRSSALEKVVVLPTAVVNVSSNSHRKSVKCIRARILLDNGSQATLISENFVRKHRIPFVRSKNPTIVSGITRNNISSNFVSKLCIESRYNHYQLVVEADVVTSIPFSIESRAIETIISLNPSLQFAESRLPSNDVDILIGAEFYESFMLNESQAVDGIFLRESQFGWVISGPYVMERSPVNSFCSLTTIEIQKFWEVEEIDGSSSKSSKESEQELCAEFVDRTLSRNEDGRFVARLPVKIDRKEIGDSFTRASQSLKRVEKRYKPDTRKLYSDFMTEYIELGHMSKIELDNDNRDSVEYYIPHRAVLRPDSTTTVLRVVFNASMPSSSGLSLNDILMVGPTIQPDLLEILIRFRVHNIAFSCDITKMYRQILVHEDDRDLQRIVWRFDVQAVIDKYRLNTITYGTGPASYIATKCLEILGNSIVGEFPRAGMAIKQDFVMDDLVTGSESVESAIELQKIIHKTLDSAHFTLRKYMSNSTEFLSKIDSSLIEKTRTLAFVEKSVISLLGLYWQPSEDAIFVKHQIKSDKSFILSLTKRQLLSEIARIYDPIGAIAPVTIRAKLLMLEVWSENRQWDDIVSQPIIQSFFEYYNDLEKLDQFSIRRRYSKFDHPVASQLIGFCDASERAYAAVIYYRSVDKNGHADCYFVAAKTKVAPKKEFKLTIPKLELQAAQLLSQLLEKVSLALKVSSMITYSDSTTILAWLNGDINRWSVFVQNRVRKISKVIPSNRWSYVNTKVNPADLATRGISVHNLIRSEIWFRGPEFLSAELEINIKPFENLVIATKELPEQRKISLLAVEQKSKLRKNALIQVIDQYSSFVKLVNIFAYIHRFIRTCNSESVIITAIERQIALRAIIRIVQYNYFRIEIDALRKEKPLSKNNLLLHLDPFLDEFGILRSRSRLQNSVLSYEYRNLVILPAKCNFVIIFVRYVHKRYYHASVAFIVNFVKSMYLVRGGIVNIVKRAVFDCTVCKRYSCKTVNQKMGQLPSVRVTVSRPFNNVGVDLAGPFVVKCTAHRVIKFGKIYAAIFVCMATKAVHIEVLSSLSTESFIATLDRFIARRGVPSAIYSDNGTNFVGSNNLLRSVRERQIEWKFIPPRAPHQGGIWEAAVKSAKRHLLRTTNGQVLNYEEYSTIFASIESVLNSRPLCQASGSVLTPGHFLVGSNLLMPSVVPADSTNVSLSQRFKLQASIINSFWRQWSKDYLNQLRNAVKWSQVKTNLQVEDVVLVKSELSAPNEWPLGIVVATYPDKENLIRTVDVKFRASVKRRNILSLVPLVRETSASSHPGENVMYRNPSFV